MRVHASKILGMVLCTVSAAGTFGAENRPCDPTQAIARDAKNASIFIAALSKVVIPSDKCGGVISVLKLAFTPRRAGSGLMEPSPLDRKKAEEQIALAQKDPVAGPQLKEAQSEADAFTRALLEAAIYGENDDFFFARDLRLHDAAVLAGDK